MNWFTAIALGFLQTALLIGAVHIALMLFEKRKSASKGSDKRQSPLRRD